MTTQQSTQTVSASSGSFTATQLIIAVTFFLLAVRWTGYAALPYLVIFAPILSVGAILGLALVLFIIVALLGALGGK